MTVAPFSFLVLILSREQVAQIKGVPVYVVTDVALIPLSSQSESEKALQHAKVSLRKGYGGTASATEGSDTSDDEKSHGNLETEGDEDISPTTPGLNETLQATPSGKSERSTSNVAQDVLERKGQYGRFAERWFSRKGWSSEKIRAQGSKAFFYSHLPQRGIA